MVAIEDMGNINNYLDINFEGLSDKNITLSKPHLIDATLRDVDLATKDSTRRTPGRHTLLGRDLVGQYFDVRFHYRAVVGKLNFLEKGSRPGIAYCVH
jgi:hypothetical protein